MNRAIQRGVLPRERATSVAALVGELTGERREGGDLERLSAREVAGAREARPQEAERGRNAERLEVLIVTCAIAVVVVRELTARELEVDLAVVVLDDGLLGVAALGEEIGCPRLAQVDHDVAVGARGGRVDLARGSAVLVERDRLVHRRGARVDDLVVRGWARCRRGRPDGSVALLLGGGLGRRGGRSPHVSRAAPGATRRERDQDRQGE